MLSELRARVSPQHWGILANIFRQVSVSYGKAGTDSRRLVPSAPGRRRAAQRLHQPHRVRVAGRVEVKRRRIRAGTCKVIHGVYSEGFENPRSRETLSRPRGARPPIARIGGIHQGQRANDLHQQAGYRNRSLKSSTSKRTWSSGGVHIDWMTPFIWGGSRCGTKIWMPGARPVAGRLRPAERQRMRGSEGRTGWGLCCR